MAYIMGLDASIQKTGYCILDTEQPSTHFVERGRLYTRSSDGILVQRLIKQQKQITDKLEEFSIDFVSMEAPLFNVPESEELYALNQYIHKVFLQRGTYVICFPPQQLKALALPDRKVTSDEIGKAHMIMEAQLYFNLEGRVVTDDEADALHAGRLGKQFYRRYILKDRSEELPPVTLKAFEGKKTFVRGDKKGTTEYTGIIYRENELFFDFKKIAQRQELHKKEDIKNGRCKNNSKKQDSEKSC